MPLAGLAKVETNRFNPQPALSSRTRPAVPARSTKINPAVRIPGLCVQSSPVWVSNRTALWSSSGASYATANIVSQRLRRRVTGQSSRAQERKQGAQELADKLASFSYKGEPVRAKITVSLHS